MHVYVHTYTFVVKCSSTDDQEPETRSQELLYFDIVKFFTLIPLYDFI